MCIRSKTVERLCNPVFKPHTHKSYILKHCTKIVYLTLVQFLYSNIYKGFRPFLTNL
jgi:hypothetical protein